MEFTTSVNTAAPAVSSSPSPTSSLCTAANSPTSSIIPYSSLTDSQLLQLALKNAVSAVAAGKATVAANNYALVVKVFFRKCFLLEELVLLALAMGYETRKAAQEATRKENTPKGGSQDTHDAQCQQHFLSSAKVDKDGANDQKSTGKNDHSRAAGEGITTEQLVDPLASVGMLLPPGLDEDDYDEERKYYEQKRQHEEELSRTRQQQQSSTKNPLQPPSGSSAFLSGLSSRSIAAAPEDTTVDVPGYDAATARWLACLLAKVHPDALPIATLEKLCKVPISSRVPSMLATGGNPNSASFGSPTSVLRGGSGEPGVGNSNNSTNSSVFPSSAAVAFAGGLTTNNTNTNTTSGFSPYSTNAIARLIPHLKSSPASSAVSGSIASPTYSTATPTSTKNFNDLAVVSKTSSSSLSLLFATLLWDVACALWNEGFVEDTHHWLSVTDVQRLWKLYDDLCANTTAAAAGTMGSPLGGNSNTPSGTRVSSLPSSAISSTVAPGAPTSAPVSRLFSPSEPPEESVESDEHACALSWPAILAECRAADEPPSAADSHSVGQQQQQSVTPPSPPSTNNENDLKEKGQVGDYVSATVQQQEQKQCGISSGGRLARPRSGITLSAHGATQGPLPMTSPTGGLNYHPAWPQEHTGEESMGDKTNKAEEEEHSCYSGEQQKEVADAVKTSKGGFLAPCEEMMCTQEDLFCFDNPTRGVGTNETKANRKEVSEDSSMSATAAPSTFTAPPATVALQAAPMLVRRLARRTSALRDLCGLMMGCETAEDVFYVIYAFHCAFQTQQRKMRQQQNGEAAAKTVKEGEAESQGTTAAPTASGGLAEVLIVASLLVEFFISKRAQKILLDAGVLPTRPSSITPGGEHGNTSAATQHHKGEQTHLMDRAIRQACDEVVCAFTNGQCMTLYGLESYGIPTPHDCCRDAHGENSSKSRIQLLAAELPYVLVSNVLSSTLNFATLYRLSKVFHGVMNARGYLSSNSSSNNRATDHPRQHGPDGTLQPSSYDKYNDQQQQQLNSCLVHSNHTRKATEEERMRRRCWTHVSTTKPATAPQHHTQHGQQQQNSALNVGSELFGFMKSVAASWRKEASSVHPMSTEAEVQMETLTSNSIMAPAIASNSAAIALAHDVRPSRMDPEMLDGENRKNSGGGRPSGTYAERLAEALRERAIASAAAANRIYESTPWSTMSPSTPRSNANSLDDARSSSGGVNYKTRYSTTAAAAKAGSVAAEMKSVPEVLSSGPEACVLLVPSHPSSGSNSNTSYQSTVSTASATALSAALTDDAVEVSHFTISLLAEENERMCFGRQSFTTSTRQTLSATPKVNQNTAADTVLYTASAQLRSRSPSEATCLRLLTLLYRYPQLHTLEPITASYVDLVVKELNKALHILQIAMRGRFGEHWWLQWRARREGETQRYYAGALADAQRGGHVLRAPAAQRTDNNTNGNKGIPLSSANPLSTSTPVAAAITGPSLASPNSAGLPSPLEPVPPLSMVDMIAIQLDPSPVMRSPTVDDSMQQPPPPALQNESPKSVKVSPSPESQKQQQGREPSPKMLTSNHVNNTSSGTVLPPSAPPATPRHEPVLSKFWIARTLTIPTEEGMRERRQNLRWQNMDAATASVTAAEEEWILTSGNGAAAVLSSSSPHPGQASTRGPTASTFPATETSFMGEDGTLVDVNWDTPPAYTPEVSLDFSAFTTTSVETQEATRQLVETLQRRQRDADDANANVAGVSLLSRACRRLLHNELPLLQQYSPWRVIYSTRMHGVSLSTLFANCRRESEQHTRLPNGLFNLPPATEQVGGVGGALSNEARPTLLILELPASTTFQFAEDDSGVRDALAELRNPPTVKNPNLLADNNAAAATEATPFNKLYIGAYLSDLLRLESRRYYGTQDCFVFQLLVPAGKNHNDMNRLAAPAAAHPPPPQLRVFHASRQNTQFINCRPTSIVIGGGGGGGSLYIDDSLCHGATSACATFDSPPLSVWQNAATTLCAVAGARQADSAEGATKGKGDTRQHSLSVINLEVIVVDA